MHWGIRTQICKFFGQVGDVGFWLQWQELIKYNQQKNEVGVEQFMVMGLALLGKDLQALIP